MTHDPLRAYFALKDRALAEADTMRRATDHREVRAAARALAALLEQMKKVEAALPTDMAGVSAAQRAHGHGLIEKAEARAKRLEKEPRE